MTTMSEVRGWGVVSGDTQQPPVPIQIFSQSCLIVGGTFYKFLAAPLGLRLRLQQRWPDRPSHADFTPGGAWLS